MSAPPATRPTTDPTLAIVPNTTIAVLRSGPFGNMVATSAIAVGVTIAAATPFRSRAKMSTLPSQAMPHIAEVMVNSAAPTIKVRL